MLSVDIFPVCDFQNRDDLSGVVDFVHDAIAPHANSPTRNIMQFATSRGRGSRASRICDL